MGSTGRLAGHNALITGGSRGIGAAVARAFEEANGNISKAAARLGMKRPRLSSLVREQGLKEGFKQ